jgi:hypothetical protein
MADDLEEEEIGMTSEEQGKSAPVQNNCQELD